MFATFDYKGFWGFDNPLLTQGYDPIQLGLDFFLAMVAGSMNPEHDLASSVGLFCTKCCILRDGQQFDVGLGIQPPFAE